MSHEAGDIRRGALVRGLLREVDEGSKGVCEGVCSALRFCVIESSIVPRESRRKSCNATVEKQNCGVSFVGTDEAWVMMMGGGSLGTWLTASSLEDFDQMKLASMSVL